uniref:RING-type domain-containing protein n=1 Tax=Salvator merianae TaxID=96440 RepID=A0A8D0DQ14_SALMN
MGLLDADRSAEPLEPSLQCQPCGQMLDEPLSTPCGHVFCANCLLPWAARRRHCPLRCQLISRQEVRRVLPLRSLVSRLEMKISHLVRIASFSLSLKKK